MAHKRSNNASSKKNTRDMHQSGPQKGLKEEKRQEGDWVQREGKRPKGNAARRNRKKVVVCMDSLSKYLSGGK
jgi:hypothetical protein